MKSTRSRLLVRWAKGLFSGALLLVLTAHFTIVAFSLLPANPISHQYKYELLRYMNPLFSQTWSLFAPNPINSNQTLLFKYYVYHSGKVQATEWVDVVEPLTNTKKHNYWSPVQRILKHISSSTGQVIEVQGKAAKFIAEHDTLKNDDTKAARFLHQVVNNSLGNRAIIEFSHYTYRRVKAATPAFAHADSVQVTYKILDQKFPRFSKRHLDYFEPKNSIYANMTSYKQRLDNRKI